MALKVGDSLEALADAKATMEGAGVAVHMTLGHHVSQGLYVSDPDGNLVELYVDADPAIWRTIPAEWPTPRPGARSTLSRRSVRRSGPREIHDLSMPGADIVEAMAGEQAWCGIGPVPLVEYIGRVRRFADATSAPPCMTSRNDMQASSSCPAAQLGVRLSRLDLTGRRRIATDDSDVGRRIRRPAPSSASVVEREVADQTDLPLWPVVRAIARNQCPRPARYESRGVVGFALTRSLVAQSAGVSSTG